MRRRVIFIDVDDTLIRTIGSKRIPMPAVVAYVRAMHRSGADLYLWSTGGGDYARSSAEELGIAECFTAFLAKPDVYVDDQAVHEWRTCEHLHPINATATDVSSATQNLAAGVEVLRSFLSPLGFHYVEGEAGAGSGGRFATGRFLRDDHEISFSVRGGLGLVAYRVGSRSISHEEFLRFSGSWGRNKYPCFTAEVIDGFVALLEDLRDHLGAFFSDDPRGFLAIVDARDAEPDRFRGLPP